MTVMRGIGFLINNTMGRFDRLSDRQSVEVTNLSLTEHVEVSHLKMKVLSLTEHVEVSYWEINNLERSVRQAHRPVKLK